MVLGTTAALLAALVLPTSAVGVDGFQSLLWGRELAHGDLGSYPAGTKPRPLMLATGALIWVLGEDAGLTAFWFLFGPVAFGVLVAATFDVAWQIASPWAGALAGSIVVTSPVILSWAGTARFELPYAALAVTALALELQRPRRGMAPLALVAMAGLIRPEAWLLGAAYWWWLGPALRGGRRFAGLALVLAGPVLWLVLDAAVTGDPLWSLEPHATDRTEVIREAGRNLVSALGPLALVVGAAGYLPAMRSRLGALSLVLNALGLTIGIFFLLHIGLGLNPDPQLPLTVCLIAILAGILGSGVRFAPPVLAAAAAFALVFQAAIRLDSPFDVRNDTNTYERAIDDARALADRPGVREALACPRAAAPANAVVTVFSYFSGRESSRWRIDRRGRRADVFVAPTRQVAGAEFLARRSGAPLRFRVPRDLGARQRTSSWVVHARGAALCARRSSN